MKGILKLVIVVFSLFSLVECYGTDSTTVEKYQTFKTEFTELELNQPSFYQNSSGRWVLAPLGVLTIVVGVSTGLIIMLSGMNVQGKSAGKEIAAGLLLGGGKPYLGFI